MTTIHVIIGIAFALFAAALFQNADLIRDSRYWALGWAGYMISILIAFDQFARAGML